MCHKENKANLESDDTTYYLVSDRQCADQPSLIIARSDIAESRVEVLEFGRTLSPANAC